jgi:hypothetical protein
MLKRTIIFILLSLPIFCNAQKANWIPYLNDSLLTYSNGYPRDKNAFYFPPQYFNDTVHWAYRYDKDSAYNSKGEFFSRINSDCPAKTFEEFSKHNKIDRSLAKDTTDILPDTFMLSWFSSTLSVLNEPILYNFQGSETIYRFTWLRSFAPPVVITIKSDSGKNELIIKKLDGQPEFDWINGVRQKVKDSLVSREGSKLHLAENRRQISSNELQEFEKMISSLRVAEQPHLLRRGCVFYTDGAEWLLEMRTKEGYYFTCRQHIRDMPYFIDKIGRKFIKLAGITKDIY